MKIISKMNNIKNYQKIIICVITAIIIAVMNFFYYNYQCLKISDAEKNYVIDLKNIEVDNIKLNDNYLKTSNENANFKIDFHYKYIRNLIIKYKSKEAFDLNLNAELANKYGILKENEREDECYSFTNISAFAFNRKAGIIEFSINKPNVVIESVTVDNSLYFNWQTFAFWFIILELILVILFYYEYFTKKIHVLAFILCMAFGLIFLICSHNMISVATDDETHYSYYSSLITNDFYTLSDYYSQSCIAPFSWQDTIIEKNEYQKFLNKSAEDELEDSNGNRSKNVFLLETNKLNYLPIAIILKICSLLNINFTTRFMIGKLVHLIIYAVVIMLAVKKIPTLKVLTLVIALLPQTVFLASNYSYDPIVTGFLLLAFAAFVDEYHNKKAKIKLSNVLIFIFAGLFGIFPKAVYSPFLLLMLLLPREKFKTKKQYIIFKLLIIGIFIASMMTFILPFVMDSSSVNDARGGNVDALEQLKLIIRNPESFMRVFYDQAFLNSANRLVSPTTYGLLSYYGGMDNDLSYLLILVSIVLGLICEKKYSKINTSNRIFIVLIILLIICFVWGSLYLGFTPLGEDVINGVQHRYFIPFLLPLLYALSTDKLKNKLDYQNIVLLCSIFIIISYSLLIYEKIISVYCL